MYCFAGINGIVGFFRPTLVSDYFKSKSEMSSGTLPASVTETSMAIRELVESVVMYNCVGREARLACTWVLQKVMDVKTDLQPVKEPSLIGTGSFWEGMPREVCGDTDCMVTHKAWPVVSELLGPEDSTSDYQSCLSQGRVIAQGIQAKPAFLRLRVSEHCPFFTVTDGYINGIAFVTNYKPEGSAEKHGPALTSSIFPSIPDEWTRDLVPCLFSCHWPSCAEEFFSRPRLHGWPSKQVLKDIRQTGCHVVAKDSPDSERPDQEFRWSFSVAERFLFHSMDDNMAACMYLLKTIKKKNWKEVLNIGICSYFLKVACFWTFECNNKSRSVLKLTTTALDWLITCYNEHNLPHYFIPNQNLIGHYSKNVCKSVAAKLSVIRQDLSFQAFLSMQLAKPVQDILQSVATEIEFQLVDPGDAGEYEQLFAHLTTCDSGLAVLRKTTKSLLKGSPLYEQKYLRHFIYDLEMLRTRVSSRLLGTEIPNPVDPPLRVIEPVLRDIGSHVHKSLVNPIETCLHAALGEFFLSCYCEIKRVRVLDVPYPAGPGDHQQPETNKGDITPTATASKADHDIVKTAGSDDYKVGGAIGIAEGKHGLITKETFLKACINIIQYTWIQERCYRKAGADAKTMLLRMFQNRAEHYYRLALVPLKSPDGRTDGGFVGRVSWAILMYVTENCKELDASISELKTCLTNKALGDWAVMTIQTPKQLVKEIAESLNSRFREMDVDSPFEKEHLIPIPASVTARQFLLIWADMHGDRDLEDKVKAWAVGSWDYIVQVFTEGRGQPLLNQL